MDVHFEDQSCLPMEQNNFVQWMRISKVLLIFYLFSRAGNISHWFERSFCKGNGSNATVLALSWEIQVDALFFLISLKNSW